jgi:hypothetical protein
MTESAKRGAQKSPDTLLGAEASGEAREVSEGVRSIGTLSGQLLC